MQASDRDVNSFRTVFKERRSHAGPSAAALKPVLAAYSGPKRLPASFEHLQQAYIKKFAPLEGYVRRARNSSSWNGRYKSFLVRSCRDSAWGSERAALVEVLRHSWSWWADCNGVSADKCPIKNLWDASFDPGASAAGSSGST